MRGARVVHENILKADPKADLSVLIVWSPILDADGRESAATLAEELKDPRAKFFWDAEKVVGKALGPRLAIGRAPFAWDVYCFFGADAEWGGRAPDVVKWAHQLGGADRSHYFGDRLGETLRAWTKELTGGKSGVAKPVPQPTTTVPVRAQDLRPIPEVLLDKILNDVAKQKDSGIDPATLAKVAGELRRRMAEATKPHAEKLPKALLRGGEVLIVSQGGCPPPDQRNAAGHKGK